MSDLEKLRARAVDAFDRVRRGAARADPPARRGDPGDRRSAGRRRRRRPGRRAAAAATIGPPTGGRAAPPLTQRRRPGRRRRRRPAGREPGRGARPDLDGDRRRAPAVASRQRSPEPQRDRPVGPLRPPGDGEAGAVARLSDEGGSVRVARDERRDQEGRDRTPVTRLRAELGRDSRSSADRCCPRPPGRVTGPRRKLRKAPRIG
jgi:hypothetical protein